MSLLLLICQKFAHDSKPFGYLDAQAHWSLHMSLMSSLVFHPSSRAAVSVAAHTATVSPDRLSTNL